MGCRKTDRMSKLAEDNAAGATTPDAFASLSLDLAPAEIGAEGCSGRNIVKIRATSASLNWVTSTSGTTQ